jgi:hypothetical protein
MSARTTILAALRTELLTVTIANGYATDTAEVLEDTIHSQQTEAGPSKVSVSIDDLGDGEALHIGAGGKMLTTLRASIRGVIWSTLGGTTPRTLASNWIGDLHKLAAKPILLGTNARYMSIGDIGEVYLSSGQAIVDVPVEIPYWFVQGAP